MKKSSVYSWLAAVAVCVGAGIMLGAYLHKNNPNTPLWIGGILVFLGAVIFGMAVGTDSEAKSHRQDKNPVDAPPKSDSDQPK